MPTTLLKCFVNGRRNQRGAIFCGNPSSLSALSLFRIPTKVFIKMWALRRWIFRYETRHNEGIDCEVGDGTSAASVKLRGRTSLNNEIHLITGLISAKEAEWIMNDIYYSSTEVTRKIIMVIVVAIVIITIIIAIITTTIRACRL